MTNKYKLLPNKYKLLPNSIDSHQTSPHWFAVVLPFDDRVTYDNEKINKGGDVSKSSSHKPTKIGLPVYLDSDIVNWSTNDGKDGQTSTISLQLANTGRDITSLISTGEWMFFWAFDNRQDYLNIKAEVRARLSSSANNIEINGFHSGLKFVGRTHGVKRMRATSANGRKTTQYHITGVGYGEFNTKVYFNRHLAGAIPGITEANKIRVLWDKMLSFVEMQQSEQYLSSQVAITNLLNVLFGKGIHELVRGNNPNTQNDVKAAGGVGESYQIPTEVGTLLGIHDADSYDDILEKYIGVQAYSQGSKSNSITTAGPKQIGVLFDPSTSTRTSTVIPLLGTFGPLPTLFNNRTFWSVLKLYLNEYVNEMYTCLRVNPEGLIMPSFIARQIPLTSKGFTISNVKMTPFVSLPIWEIDDALVYSDKVGPSDSSRENYVQIYGQHPIFDKDAVEVTALNQNPPIYNSADIARNGMSPITTTVNNAFLSTTNDSNNSVWAKIYADITFDSHLRWSGTLDAIGIQEPICPGDNCLHNGILYHIERILHNGGITADGHKSFNTTIVVTYGIDGSMESLTSPTNAFIGVNGKMDTPDEGITADIKNE